MGGTCVTFSRIYLGLVLLLFISSCVGRIGDDNFDRPLNETQRLRRLEEIMGSPTSRRLCVRALSVLRADLFKTQIPDSDTDVYMSCMSCTPTRPTHYCTKACQADIDMVYNKCDGICLPTNYYFDAAQTLTGCWKSVQDEIRIEVERCGCSAAHRSTFGFGTGVASLIALSTTLLAWWAY